jgi:stage IV sporulation protein FB
MIKPNKFFIPCIILLVVIAFSGQLLPSFLMVIAHEFVHYITAVIFGYSGFDLKILPIGAVLQLKDLDEASPKEDLVISMSGPLFNIILALIFYMLSLRGEHSFYSIMIKSNLALGVFNLIPAFPLDGGRILRDILCIKTIYKRANEITIKCSVAVGLMLIGCFIFLLFFNTFNYSIGVIGCFVIFSSYKEKKRIVYIIMGDIVKKKRKFLERKYIENKSISIFYKIDLINVLSLVDKNKYNIFTVLDENMRVLDIIYEEEVIEALKVYGNITVEEFVDVRQEKEDLEDYNNTEGY